MLEDKDLLSIQEVRTKVEKAFAAWQKYRTYSQEQVDAIVERMAAAARANAKRLADLAVEETGYGNAKDKYIKNLLNCDWLPRRMRGMKTVGILRELPEEKIVEIGVPVGVVAAILPTTNPDVHRHLQDADFAQGGQRHRASARIRARTSAPARRPPILYQAALEAGAPEDIIQCVDRATMEGTNALMRHERTSVILSTGGHAHGEGGLFERQAGVRRGTGQRAGAGGHFGRPGRRHRQDRGTGKSFDYGTVCSSEQALVAEVHAARPHSGAAQSSTRRTSCNDAADGRAGQAADHAQLDGESAVRGPGAHQDRADGRLRSAADTSILCCEIAGVGKQYPLSAEKLSPVLSLLLRGRFRHGARHLFRRCSSSAARDTPPPSTPRTMRASASTRMRMPAMRVLVNTPAPQGSTGITTNVFPSMTLGCGAMAGNSTSDNVGPLHLINIKRLAYTVRTPEEAFEMPLDYDKARVWLDARRRRTAARSIARP